MSSLRLSRRLAGLALLFILTIAPLAAQSVLCVESAGKVYVVRKVREGRPIVEKDGKLVAVTASRCALKPAPEYIPAFVSVRDIQVSESHLEYTSQSGSINHTFNFTANFSSTYALAGVYLALELNTENSGKVVFYYEVGDLGPGKRKSLNLHVPITDGFGKFNYNMHLFTEGLEVFHSQHPMPYRESVLDRMVSRRIADVKDANPKPFFGPTPEYPKALRKAGTKGTALLKIRITRTGAVLDPVVQETTDPAFGEAAVVAVRMWRFLPKVENGRAVETTATLPFEFAPPPEGEKS